MRTIQCVIFLRLLKGSVCKTAAQVSGSRRPLELDTAKGVRHVGAGQPLGLEREKKPERRHVGQPPGLPPPIDDRSTISQSTAPLRGPVDPSVDRRPIDRSTNTQSIHRSIDRSMLFLVFLLVLLLLWTRQRFKVAQDSDTAEGRRHVGAGQPPGLERKKKTREATSAQ